MILTLLASVLMGAIGGVANSLLVEEGFAKPRRVFKDQNKTVWNPGFLGNIILGAIAAMATYLLGASELKPLNQWGIALVSGVGGGNLLNSLRQKQETSILKAQIETLAEAVRRAMELPNNP